MYVVVIFLSELRNSVYLLLIPFLFKWRELKKYIIHQKSYKMVEYNFIQEQNPVLRSLYSKGAEWTINCWLLIIKYPTYLLPHSIIQDFCVKDCIKDSYMDVLFIVPQTLNRKTITSKLFVPFWLFESSTWTFSGFAWVWNGVVQFICCLQGLL